MRSFNNLLEVQTFILESAKDHFNVRGLGIEALKAKKDGNYEEVKKAQADRILAYEVGKSEFSKRLLEEICENQPRFKKSRMYFNLMGLPEPPLQKGSRVICEGYKPKEL